ncbi:MAG: hypothetical protein A3H29_08775 [Acidobacteria bacterium RIFCSPLOWO2_02_FULL_67_21]|nr:MAG: hypothetical protein A3H29_08775 [Acidobacteria bacterium RIFCSPLOWO2_02_FULL_67_21]
MSHDLRRSVVRGVFWSGVQQASDRGLRMLVFVILAALVEPAVIGVVALAMVFVDGLGLLLNQGLTAALVQRENLTQSHKSSAFVANLCMAFVLMAALYLAAGPISAWFGNPDLQGLLRWLSLGLMFTALAAVQEASLRRELRFRVLAVRTLASRCVGAAVGVVLALRGHGAWSLVFMYLVNQGVGVAVLWLASSWRPSLRFSWTSYKDLLDFGLRILGGETMAVVRNRGGDLLVGSILGETALGFFSLAKTLVGGVFSLIDGAIAPVAWAMMSRLQHSPQKFAQAIEESAQLTATIVLPAGAGLLVTASPLIELLYRDRWLPTLPVIYSLVVCRTLSTFMGHNRTALTAVGEINTSLLLSGVATILTVAGIAAGSLWGLIGVAVGLVIATGVQTPIDLFWSFKLLPVMASSFLFRLVPPTLLTLAMFLSLLVLRPLLGDGWLGLTLLVLSGVLIYSLGSLVAAPKLVERIHVNLLAGMRGNRRGI